MSVTNNSVTNNSIKVKCNDKELYNLLIQDIRVEVIGSGWVVTIITDPPNAALLYYTRNNRMYITSYTEEFKCTVEFPVNVSKSVGESYAFKDVITLRGNHCGHLMDVSVDFSEST